MAKLEIERTVFWLHEPRLTQVRTLSRPCFGFEEPNKPKPEEPEEPDEDDKGGKIKQ